MGYNARNDEIRDNVTRMRREWEAQRDALATVRRFNPRLSAKGYSWFCRYRWIGDGKNLQRKQDNSTRRPKPGRPRANTNVGIGSRGAGRGVSRVLRWWRIVHDLADHNRDVGASRGKIKTVHTM